MSKPKEPTPTAPDARPEQTKSLEPAHDVCIYCGHDNGPVDAKTGRGISRGIGRGEWDCFKCGGN